ncbi:MAG TPA: hypothetical protein VGF43_15015 [Dongiaceae bacterium]
MAERARRLAWLAADELTMTRLTEFAKELEARVAALEPAAQTFSHADAAAVLKSRTTPIRPRVRHYPAGWPRCSAIRRMKSARLVRRHGKLTP